MRNIMIIILIVVSMGYMFSILFDRYQTIIEQEDNKKTELQRKTTKE